MLTPGYEVDDLVKVVLIGESNTGKTSLLLRFIQNSFDHNYQCTIGFDFKVKTLQIDHGAQLKIQAWDTVGQERFRSMT
jgi:small GTP-binding protein